MDKPDAVPETARSSTPLLVVEEFGPLPVRKISEATCRRWNYGVSTVAREKVQVAQYHDDSGNVIAQKYRTANKRFGWRGKSKDAGLYGRHLWRNGGKSIIITEGEIDAMTVDQLQGYKWPVVSVENGAHNAVTTIRNAIEWLEKFEKVVFMFDSDAPGREAAEKCAQLLSPGKAYIARLPLKDANELHVAGRSDEVIKAFWDAKAYRPDGVINASEIKQRILDKPPVPSLPYPFPTLQKLTRGAREGEVVLLTAGSGVGKTEIARQIIHHFHSLGDTIGILALEEPVERTALGLIGLEVGRRVHLDDEPAKSPDVLAALDSLFGTGRVFLYDHFGSLDPDVLVSRIRYMAVGGRVKTILLDHISIVVSGSAMDDERKALDVIMTKLASIATELKIRLFVIAHLKRVDGKSFTEGSPISLNDLRGSAALEQLSFIVIGFERNQQSPDKSQLTQVRILKNRWTGEVGLAGVLQYDTTSGRLNEVINSPFYDSVNSKGSSAPTQWESGQAPF